ncbi:Phosphate acetyltransferase [Candidatus Hepatincola sp. Pdp]
MNSFEQLLQKAKSYGLTNTAVVNPIDEVSLGGAIAGFQHGVINPILYGLQTAIESTAKKHNFDVSKLQIINCESEEQAVSSAIKACNTGQAQILMKGKIHTDHLMHAVVQRDSGLRITGQQISHVFTLEVPTYHKLLFITDAAINIFPSVEQKQQILLNAVAFLNKLGIKKPKIACLSALEEPYEKIEGSVAARSLALNEKLQQCSIIEGPLAFDNAISKRSANIKDIKSEVAGDVDLLLVPNLEAGNILFKSLVYLAKAKVAGVVLGAKVPIVLTSRADDANARLYSAILAQLNCAKNVC